MKWRFSMAIFMIGGCLFAGDAIRVMTWNVLADSALKDKRVPSLLKVVESQKADLIAFQETTGWFVRELKKTAWSKDYPFRVGPVRGLYVISKFEIRGAKSGPLPSRQGRGWLTFDVKKGDTIIRIGTCHLESPLADGVTREKQIEVFAKQFAGAKHAIFMGDFNFGDGEAEHKKLKDWGDAWAILHPGKPGFTWNMEKNPMAVKGAFPKEKSRRLDRIFVRGMNAKKVEIIGDKAVVGFKGVFPSDHFGLVADLSAQPVDAVKETK